MSKKRFDWQTKFIDTLRVLGNVWVAAQQASVARTNVYDEYNRDPEFAKKWDAAEQESADRLEAEAWRRAHDGIDKPIYWQGERVDTVKEYSDTLLVLLLRARRPAKFRENYSVAVGNPDGSALVIDNRQQAINLFTSSPEAAQHMIALANLMVPEESMAKSKLDADTRTPQQRMGDPTLAEKIVPFDPTQDCAPGNLAHLPITAPVPPVTKDSKPKAPKARKAKKSAPQAQEIEIDDSAAVPMPPPVNDRAKAMADFAAAFLPKTE